jgi:hypothetical protein
MDRSAAWHLGQLARELLEVGFERVEIEREVRTLELGDQDLDGREVNCIAVTVGDAGGSHRIVAIEDAFADDGFGYTAALAKELRGEAAA